MEIGLGDLIHMCSFQEEYLSKKSSFERCPAPPNWFIATNLIPTDKRGNLCPSYWHHLLMVTIVVKLSWLQLIYSINLKASR